MSRIVPYEGNGNYIFISYSHKDMELVTNLMQRLQQDGFHVWYDEGIEPGTDWSENVAQHMHRSALILAVGTQNYVDSNNCRQEIEFAISENHNVLVIWLEAAELPLGLKMRLSATQSIYRQNFTNDEAFFQKMYKSAAMQLCRDQEPEDTSVDADKDRKPSLEIKPSLDRKSSLEINPSLDRKPSPEMNSTLDRKPSQEVKPDSEQTPSSKEKTTLERSESALSGKKNKKKQEGRPAKAQLRKKRLFCILALIAGLILAAVAWNSYNHVTIAGEAYKRNDISVGIYNTELTDSDLKTISSMHKLRYLGLINCDIDNEKLASIHFSGMPGLTTVVLESNRELTDLGPLQAVSASIEKIDLDDTGVTDLGPVINSESLREISLCNTGLKELTQICRNTNLRSVNVSDNQISDLKPLSGLTRLEQLNVDHNSITSLEGLEDAVYLECLYLRGNTGLTDLGPIGNCTQLEEVDLGGTSVRDLSLLHKSAEKLSALFLDDTGVSEDAVIDLSKACPRLAYLNLDRTGVTDLTFTAQIPLLQYLSADGNGITSLPDLTNMEKLTFLSVAENKLTDINITQNIPKIAYLICRDNEITSLRTEAKISYLDARHNPCTLYHAGDQADLGAMYITYQPGLQVEGSYLNVQMVDCPGDQIVAMQNQGYGLIDESQAMEDTRNWKTFVLRNAIQMRNFRRDEWTMETRND